MTFANLWLIVTYDITILTSVALSSRDAVVITAIPVMKHSLSTCFDLLLVLNHCLVLTEML